MNIIIQRLHGKELDFAPVLSKKELKTRSFEDLIYSRIKKFIGMSYDDICNSISFDSSFGGKAKYAFLVSRMLGAKNKKVEEFEKAGVEVKAIRLNKKGYPKESMSFPHFDYIELSKEIDWEESETKSLFDKKFFFMIFQENEDNELIFKKGMFWNIPVTDLENVKDLWEKVRINMKQGVYGNTEQKANLVSHIRPHAKDGNDKIRTPSGTKEVKRCFWLNASYLYSIVNKDSSS